MSSDKSVGPLTLVSAVGSTLAASYLFKHFNTERIHGIYVYKEDSPSYNLLNILNNVERLHDFQNDILEETGVLTL